MIRRVGRRDLMQITAGNAILVVSCDSLGGIGSLKDDVVRVDPYSTGFVGIRPALFEILCIGAEPIMLINTLTVRMNYGKRILEGMMDALKRWDVKIFGSTEENVPTTQTGIGITLIGRATTLRKGLVRRGDLAVAFGQPRVGKDVLDANDVCTTEHLIRLLETEVREIIPTGSRGIGHEVEVIARENNLKVRFLEDREFLSRSCGPSTVVVGSVSPDDIASIDIDLPVRVVGEFL